MRVSFKKLMVVVLFQVGVVALTGCENLDVYKKPPIEVGKGADGKVSNKVGTDLTSQDLRNITTNSTRGAVEIFDLNGGGASPSRVSSVEPDYIGIPTAKDPRVIVYPIDGDTGAYPSSPSGYLPMGQYNYNSMSPNPNGAWDDGSMGMDNGVLSPRVGQNVSSVYFGYGSARLNQENKQALSSVAETAKFAPVDRVSIEGHASRQTQTNDPVKSKVLNLKESMNRAQAVSEQLIRNGVPAEKIKTTAWGDTRPSGGGDAQNRRVDIVTGYNGQ